MWNVNSKIDHPTILQCLKFENHPVIVVTNEMLSSSPLFTEARVLLTPGVSLGNVQPYCTSWLLATPEGCSSPMFTRHQFTKLLFRLVRSPTLIERLQNFSCLWRAHSCPASTKRKVLRPNFHVLEKVSRKEFYLSLHPIIYTEIKACKLRWAPLCRTDWEK